MYSIYIYRYCLAKEGNGGEQKKKLLGSQLCTGTGNKICMQAATENLH